VRYPDEPANRRSGDGGWPGRVPHNGGDDEEGRAVLGDDAALLAPGDGAPPGPGRSLESRAARGTLWSVAGALIVKGLQTAVLLLLARLLDPSALGVLSIGTLVLAAASIVQDVGLTEVISYRQDRVEEAARTCLTLILGASLLLTALCWVAAPWVARFLNAPAGTDVIRGLTVVLPCYAVVSGDTALLKRELAFHRRFLIDVIPAVTGGVVAIVLAVGGHGIASLVVGQVVTGVLTPFVAWSVGPRVRPGWNAGLARESLAYGRHVVGAEAVQMALLNVDYVIVARFLGSTRLGLYSLAFRLCYMPFLNVAYVVNGAAFPYYCRLPSRRDLPAAVVRVSTATFAVVLPLYLAIAVLAPHITLLGPAWAPAVPVIRWLAVYGVLLCTAQAGQTVLRAVGRPDLAFVSRLVHLAALTAALLTLTRNGVTWVGVAQVVAGAVVTGVTVAFARRATEGFDPREFLASLAPLALSGGVLVVVTLAARAALPSLARGDSLAGAVTFGLLALAAYAVPAWLLAGDRLRQAVRVVRG
jgi:O-antigen/teichoic acid export membrane protein